MSYHEARTHTCCDDSSICKCPYTSLYKSPFHDYTFECQEDKYNCGPIAILNILRMEGRYSGQSQRRMITTACDVRSRHPDGFAGTRPEKITHIMEKFWPDRIIHTEGFTNCRQSLLEMGNGEKAVLLIIMPRKGFRKMYYHYIMVYKQDSIFFAENLDDMSKEMKLDNFSKHMPDCIYPGTDIVLPQVWRVI